MPPQKKGNLLKKEDELYKRSQRKREIEERGGLYGDRLKIDPQARGYEWPVMRRRMKRVAGRATKKNGRRRA